MHKQLLKYKQLAEEGTNLMNRPKQEKANVETEKQQPRKETTNETIDELLLRVATDLEYRKKVKLFLNTLETHPVSPKH